MSEREGGLGKSQVEAYQLPYLSHWCGEWRFDARTALDRVGFFEDGTVPDFDVEEVQFLVVVGYGARGIDPD